MPLALAAMLTGRALPEPEKAGRRFDQLGSLLCAATFGLLIFGLHFITAAPSPLLPAALLFAGLAAGFALIWYELRHPHPVLPVDLLRQKAMALSTGAGLCGYLASTSLILALPFRLHADGYSAGQIGVVILPYAASATIFAPAAGMLSDRISPTKLGVVGTAIAFVALVFLTRLPAAPTHLQVQWPMALCGVGFGLFMAPNARLIIGAVSADRAASASSLISTTRMMSQAIASTFVGALLAFGVWPASAIIAACLTALAFCLSLARLWSRES
jgi:DHA2 family multidrug resistance protein-like MFS transporter